jgi:hypothetical protein
MLVAHRREDAEVFMSGKEASFEGGVREMGGCRGVDRGLVSREAKTGRRNRNKASLEDDGLREGLGVNRRERGQSQWWKC